ncbi:Crp/Fnr family transcriptional regulator [Methylohalobius crimeensis]|uniref:Crp/Fnr family transcriptional regulator n=1 Tax=Methylohalobius crimeensis TaxID=244365 RepID=UPI0003B47197|nr:Crp/Fnr family transcriptional regulator [Methylohalobius crimeensis]
MADLDTPRQNHLLDALTEAAYARLSPQLERVYLSSGEVLSESGHEMVDAYFPATCIVSLLYVLQNGASSEIAVIGKEGMTDVGLFMGGQTTPNKAVVWSGGYAYRLRRDLLMREFTRTGGRRKGVLHNVLLRYTQTLLVQMAQTAVCNRHHFVNQRLCRWLLLNLDRLSSNQLTATQEWIAGMLGVRRESITEAAGELQRANVIVCSRGRITVQNRAGLEARACECYQVIKGECDRLLPSNLDGNGH